jgi:hypothetical protein
MPWNRVSLSDYDMLAGKADKLQSDFTKVWISAGFPSEAVMYANRSPRLQHEYYFTPRAAEIGFKAIKSYGAVPCEEPKGEALIPLVEPK